MEKVYIVSIQEHYSWRIVFVSGDIEKVKKFLQTVYKLNNEDVTYLIEWKELYNMFIDSKLTLEEIELDKDYSKISTIEF
jgi:ABC-type dipeptide/oligopeptide/nickel transport system ATPase subunit